MNTNKGFTLVELLGSIVILATITLLIIPMVDKNIKNSREQALITQIQTIEKATESWALANVSSLPLNDDAILTITLGQLKKDGLLPLNIKNPVTNTLFPNDMLITITRKPNTYLYNVDTSTGILNDDTTYDIYGPAIMLVGNYVKYVEIDSSNSPYVDEGAIAKKNNGDIIPELEIDVIYMKDGVEVSDIDTNAYDTYTITYSVTDNGILNKITRTIIFRDTTPPQLTIPDNQNLDLNEVGSFNLMTGVSAIDNSGEVIVPTVIGEIENEVGRYIVTYKAIDSHNNETAKKRIINVIQD